GRMGGGRCGLARGARDRRFADPAWTANPVLRRLVQAYIAAGAVAVALVDDANLGWRDTERVGVVVRNLVDAAAPSNNPLVSPEAWKAIIDSGGVRGARRRPPRPPRRGCRPWCRRTRSRSAATSRSRRAPSSAGRRSASLSSTRRPPTR